MKINNNLQIFVNAYCLLSFAYNVFKYFLVDGDITF